MADEKLILGKVNIEPLLKASKKFCEAFIEAESELEKAGLIQYFEFTYELAWKTMKKVLMALGINERINNPKDVFREAARNNLIDDPVQWMEFLHDRNLTVHTYNESTAKKIYENMDEFKAEIEKLIVNLEKLDV